MGAPMATSQDFVNWICSEALDPEFLMYSFVAEGEHLLAFGKGTTHTTIYFPEVQAFQLTLPPLNEQRRIVDKIEALNAKSRRAKEALEAIPPLLEKFRQSILAAAFRGDLTADWRAKNPDVEPASKLLERIRTERRRRWEEAELEKLRAKGTAPKDDRWKAKYQEPAPVDTEGLPELPEGWVWASVDELLQADTLAYGILKPGDPVPSGVPMVRVMDLKSDTIDRSELAHVAPELALQFSRTRLQAGDVLLAVMATIGRCAIVPSELEGANVNRALAVLRLGPHYTPQLFCWNIRSPQFTKTFLSKRLGSAQQRINLGDLAQFPVAVPPPREQPALLAAIASCLALLATVSKRVDDALSDAKSCDSAILAKAFRGELAPQAPADEPASILLERIRAERADQVPTSRERLGRKRAPRREAAE